MEPLKESLRPRPRPRIQTGKKTLRNRVVWADENFKNPYAELTVTVPWGEGYAVIPTVDASGNILSTEEALEKTLEKKLLTSKGNPLDFITNEELPVFGTEEEANRYAQWRSDSMFDPEAIAAGFDREPIQIFPDAPPPEVDNRSITNKVINKLNEWLAKGGIKAYRGEIEGFNKGALVEQRPMSFSGVAAPDTKGLSYSEIILDSIIGLENNYETGVEGIVKQFNQDRVSFLKTIGKTIYDETVDFISSPVDMQGLEKVNPMVAPELKVAEFGVNIANEIKEAVKRLSSQDLSTRLQSMFGVDYETATDDQVSKARESVLGDALIVAEVIPAVRAASKAVPGEVKADLMGQTRALLEGDIVEFSQTSSQPPKGVGANVPGMFPERVAKEDTYMEQGEEKDFYALKESFIPLFDGTTPAAGPVAVGFLDALTEPEIVNPELDTMDLIEINFDSNLSDYMGSARAPGQHLSITLDYVSDNPEKIQDFVTDEKYTALMLEKDGFTTNQIRSYLGDENAAWWRTLSDDQGIYVDTVPIDQVVEPLYFTKVMQDIAEGVQVNFSKNLNKLNSETAFTLLGLLRMRDVYDPNYGGNPDLSVDATTQMVISEGIADLTHELVKEMGLLEDIYISDPRYFKSTPETIASNVGEPISVDLTPREKYTDVNTGRFMYKTDPGKKFPGENGYRFKFENVFGQKPIDTPLFIMQGIRDLDTDPVDGKFQQALYNLIHKQLDYKLNVNDPYLDSPDVTDLPSLEDINTISGRSLGEVSRAYANEHLRMMEESAISSARGSARGQILDNLGVSIIQDLATKTDKPVPGSFILKQLKNNPGIKDRTIPPYFLTEQFKNQIIRPNTVSDDWVELALKYRTESPTINYPPSTDKYSSYQRQEREYGGRFIGGKTQYYKGLRIEAEDFKTGERVFTPVKLHFDDRDIAHTRVSYTRTYDPKTENLVQLKDPDFLPYFSIIKPGETIQLVHEVQSDLFSEGVKKYSKIDITPERVEEVLKHRFGHGSSSGENARVIEEGDIPVLDRYPEGGKYFKGSKKQLDSLIKIYDLPGYTYLNKGGKEVFETVSEVLNLELNLTDGSNITKPKYYSVTDAGKLQENKIQNLTNKIVGRKRNDYNKIKDVNKKLEILRKGLQDYRNRLEENYNAIQEITATKGGAFERKQQFMEEYDRVKFLQQKLFSYDTILSVRGEFTNIPKLKDIEDAYFKNLAYRHNYYLNSLVDTKAFKFNEFRNPSGIKNLVNQAQINLAAARDPEKYGSAPIRTKSLKSKDMEDFVELVIQRLINDAQAEGVTKIVIPSFARIAELRFDDKELEFALQNKSYKVKYDPDHPDAVEGTGHYEQITEGHPLYKVHNVVIPKVLQKFQKEYGIKVYENVQIPHQTFTDDLGGEETVKYLKDKSDLNKGTVIDIEDASKTYDFQKPAYAKGGTVMNKQMEMAFMKQGGIKDDGMTKDPVSGNEIPPGSMATEVRDNIPAMLSEGEYVVPADVLRYYGVNFFENLRGQAKQGLQNMERNGRIGGTPMTQQDVARNMQQPVMANTGAMLEPERQDPPQAMGNQTPGFNQPVQTFSAGSQGAVQQQTQPNLNYISNFSPATARLNTPMFTGTSSQLANVSAAQQQADTQEVTSFVTHYDKDGNQMQIKYVSVGGSKPKPADGQNDLLKQYNMTETQYADYKKTQKQGSGIDKKPNPFEKPKVDNIGPLVNIGAMDAVGVKEWATGHLKDSKIQKITKPFGPLIQSIGIGDQARRIAEVRAMAKYKENLGGQANIDLAKELNAQADALINNPGLEALDALGLMSGNKIYKDMIGYKPGDSQPSLPNAANGQTKAYMFVDEDGTPLTSSDYRFAAALRGEYGWQAKHFAVQQLASMKLAEKGIEDNTYYGGGTQSDNKDITPDDKDPDGGGSSDDNKPPEQPTITTPDVEDDPMENIGATTTPSEQINPYDVDEAAINEGGLMTTPKPKKKRGRPKKSGLAGKK